MSAEAWNGQYIRPNTLHDHRVHIVAYFGYVAFEGRQAFRLTRWLYAQVLTSTMRPSVLFDLATAYLVAQRVVLPGVTVLARLIARVRERTGRHIYRQLRTRLTPAQQAVLGPRRRGAKAAVWPVRGSNSLFGFFTSTTTVGYSGTKPRRCVR